MEKITGSPRRRFSVGEYSAELLHRRWLSENTFELELSRPPSFEFLPGQRIRLIWKGIERDYSLVSTPDDPTLALCIRRVDGGALSPLLARAAIGSRFHFSGPHGYFVFRESGRSTLLVATGVGIAPFVSIVRSGVSSCMLLHGVRVPAELHYEATLRGRTGCYVPCLSGGVSADELPRDAFRGKVTEYLINHVTSITYDIYVCGRGEMVRDVVLLVDEHFPGSYVYTEIFF
jgi:benzoate/toluate 1,2-dioxygenase reductase subunit